MDTAGLPTARSLRHSSLLLVHILQALTKQRNKAQKIFHRNPWVGGTHLTSLPVTGSLSHIKFVDIVLDLHGSGAPRSSQFRIYGLEVTEIYRIDDLTYARY